jgi:hypothetical protein
MVQHGEVRRHRSREACARSASAIGATGAGQSQTSATCQPARAEHRTVTTLHSGHTLALL